MQSNPAPRDLTKPTVLVVDDSLVDRTLYVHMVEKWGYPVEVASDGEQAIEIIRSKRIQLVLADWQMPGMMGTDLCIRLRKLGTLNAFRAVLRSHYPESVQRECLGNDYQVGRCIVDDQYGGQRRNCAPMHCVQRGHILGPVLLFV